MIIMNRWTYIIMVIVFLSCFNVCYSAAPQDNVLKRYQVMAIYVGTEFGDYVHSTFKMKNGKTATYFVDDKVLTKLEGCEGKTFLLDVEVVSTFIPEANEKMTIEIVTKAKMSK